MYLKRWEKIGQPMGVGLNNFPSATTSTLISVLTSSALGFGTRLHSIGSSSNGTGTGDVDLYSKTALALSYAPIDTFSFPYGAQYHATSSQFIKAKDLGITKPFLLEKIKLNFDIRLETPLSDHNGIQTIFSKKSWKFVFF